MPDAEVPGITLDELNLNADKKTANAGSVVESGPRKSVSALRVCMCSNALTKAINNIG